MSQKQRMECFRPLFDHLAWIKHQCFFDSRKARSLWGMMKGVGRNKEVNTPELICHSKTDARLMQDGRKAVRSIPYVSVAFFPSLKQNFIAYRSSKVSDCIFKIHQLWQSGFSRVYSNCCCRCSFKTWNHKNWSVIIIRCIAITNWISKSLRQF